MEEQNYINYLRRETLRLVAKAFMAGEAPSRIDKIPFELRPKNSPSNRCCVYKDRAILRYRCMAALGYLPEDEADDSIPLAEFAAKAQERENSAAPFVISACDVACHACVPARYFVTDVCQGCIARPCVGACHFNAISIVDNRSRINVSNCKNCGKCMEACPYYAIVRLTVPCERSCPVKAIVKGEGGRAEIDFSRCISCGRCMRACPFGAVLERSEIIDVLRMIAQGQPVAALLAPAISGQFQASLPQVFHALKRLGFSEVWEVASGADITSAREAAEFVERMEEGQPFMTTSCCPGYIQSVNKHIPEVRPFVSSTCTPMHYTAELARQANPEIKTVFIGPCVAKRVEKMDDPLVDCVLTFEELGALFQAAEIDLADCPEEDLGAGASSQGRRYAVSGGVAAAVAHTVADKAEVLPVQINGLSPKGLTLLKSYAKGKAPGNLIEVMACEGGCAGGSGVLGQVNKVTKAVENFAKQGG